jgi:hypothetical protein
VPQELIKEIRCFLDLAVRKVAVGRRFETRELAAIPQELRIAGWRRGGLGLFVAANLDVCTRLNGVRPLAVLSRGIIVKNRTRVVNALFDHGHVEAALGSQFVKVIVNTGALTFDEFAKSLIRIPEPVEGHQLFDLPHCAHIGGCPMAQEQEEKHSASFGRPRSRSQKFALF